MCALQKEEKHEIFERYGHGAFRRRLDRDGGAPGDASQKAERRRRGTGRRQGHRGLRRNAEILNISIDPAGAKEIAKRSRGTPRIANRLLKRVRDFAEVEGSDKITDEIADRALQMLEVDKVGLDHTDRRMLETMIKKFNGGPVGLETIAASISETRETIEDIYEPFLMQLGFIVRTPRGRVVTQAGYEHMGFISQKSQDETIKLFDFEKEEN